MPELKQEAPKGRYTTHTVEFGEGRRLTFRTPSLRESTNLMRILGGDTASNFAVLNTAMMVAGVREIDGLPLVFPDNQRQLDEAMDRVDGDPFEALGIYYRDVIAPMEKPEATRQDVKN